MCPLLKADRLEGKKAQGWEILRLERTLLILGLLSVCFRIYVFSLVHLNMSFHFSCIETDK